MGKFFPQQIVRCGAYLFLLGIVFVVPTLPFAVDLPREFFLRCVVALLLPFAVWSLTWQSPKTWSLLPWASVCVLGWFTLATIFSVIPSESFWGQPSRMNGLITIIVSFLTAWLITRSMQQSSDQKRWFLLWSIFWSGTALFALLEWWIPGLASALGSRGDRTVGLAGNSIYLASGLLLGAIGQGMGIAKYFIGNKQRIAYIATAIVFGAALISTGTRGALLGVLLAVIGWGTVVLWKKKTRWSRVMIITIALFVIIGGIFLRNFSSSSLIQSSNLLTRISRSFQGNDTSAVQRFQMWQMALAGIKEKPVFGWGPELFDVTVDQHYLPNFTRYEVANSWTDRAHNEYLDLAVIGGIPLLCAVLFLFFTIARRVWQQEEHASRNIFLWGMLAYLIAYLTGFESRFSLLALAMLWGILLWKPRAITSTAFRAPLLQTIGASVCSFFLLWSVVVVIPPARALVRALHAQGSTAMLADAVETIARHTENPYHAYFAQRACNEVFKTIGNNVKHAGAPERALLTRCATLLESDFSVLPTFTEAFTRANIIVLQATMGDRTVQDGLDALDRAQQLAPNRQITMYQRVNLLLAAKEYTAAVAEAKKAFDLDPTIGESKWAYARALATSGDVVQAAQQFLSALNGGFGSDRPANEYSIAVRTFLAQSDYHTVARLYALWEDAEPNNAQVFASAAVAYAEIGDVANVVTALRHVLALDPSYGSEIPAFLAKYHLPSDILEQSRVSGQ